MYIHKKTFLGGTIIMWKLSLDMGKNTAKVICAAPEEAKRKGDPDYKKLSLKTVSMKVSRRERIPVNPEGMVVGALNEEGKTEYHIVGEGAQSRHETSKMSEVHRKCAYALIGKNIPNGEKIAFSLAIPVDEYKNPELIKAYVNYFLQLPKDTEIPDNLSENPVKLKFILNGKELEYNVVDIAIFPEASGFLFKHENFFKDKKVIVIDIGGLNTNVGIFNNLAPEIIHYHTLIKGSNALINTLKDKIDNITRSDNSLDSIEEYLLQGLDSLDDEEMKEDISEEIEIIKEVFVSELMEELRVRKYEIEKLDIIFTGGTSKLLEEAIRKNELVKNKKFKRNIYISEDPQWDNAEGHALALGIKIKPEKLKNI